MADAMLSAMRRSGCTMSPFRAPDIFDEDPASAHTIRPADGDGNGHMGPDRDAVKRVQVGRERRAADRRRTLASTTG